MNSTQPSPLVRRTEPDGELKFQMIASGIETLPTEEPLVTIYSTEFEDTFHLCIHVYVPDDVTPKMDADFTKNPVQSTLAGSFPVRQLKITYDDSTSQKYSLWLLETDYTVEKGNGAAAIRVYFDVGDPRASRGTVTTVANT